MGLSIKQGKADLAKHDVPKVVAVRDISGNVIVDGEGKPAVTWSLLGTYSKVYRRVRDQLLQRGLKRGQKKQSSEEVRANQIELVASCVTAWTGMDDDDGQPKPLTKENAAEYLRELPNLLDQMLEEQGDSEGFTGSASTT